MSTALSPLGSIERSDIFKLIGLILLMILLPLVLGSFLTNQIIVFSIFAIGFNLLFGYSGKLAFGHAAFFGVGAYGTVLALEHLTSNLYAAMVLAVIVATAVGAVYGWISLRRRGIAFAMITLALAQMSFYILFQTTGSDGLTLPVTNAPIGPLDPVASRVHFYLFGLVVLLAVYVASWRIVKSPFGRVAVSIRENEERALHLGYNTDRFLLVAFVVSSLISGIAGAMQAVAIAFVSPDLLFWTTSGEVLLMTIIGGVGTLGGPIIGAVVLTTLTETLLDLTRDWEVIYGVFIIAIVLIAPDGIYGAYQTYVQNEEPRQVLRTIFENLRS